jgi:molybdopterin molybdotransferase
VVLATGTELRSPGEELEPGEIYESNTLALRAQLESASAQVTVLQAVTDDEPATRAALSAGLEADVLVTSGGVSVGEHDLVRAVLADLGAEEVFWRVAVRPGKPVAFATLGATLAFGLPGNPVSALVGFELFVRPAILALQGAAEPGPFYLPGRLAAAVRCSEEREALVRARVRVGADGVVLEPLAGQESHMIVHAAAADALVRVPRGSGELPAGGQVMYLPL